MSLAADPNQTFEYSLEADMQLAAKQRPVFLIKFLTTRQWRQLVEFREKLKGITSGEEMNIAVIEQVKPYILGWRNVKDSAGQNVQFAPDKIEDVLSIENMYELISAENNRQFLTAADKKKLD
jgi:hypothetical protein